MWDAMLVCVLFKTAPNKLNKLENAVRNFVSYIKDYTLSNRVSFYKSLHLMREMALSPYLKWSERYRMMFLSSWRDTSLRNKIQTLSNYYGNDIWGFHGGANLYCGHLGCETCNLLCGYEEPATSISRVDESPEYGWFFRNICTHL
jgi:hypothetical protein